MHVIYVISTFILGLMTAFFAFKLKQNQGRSDMNDIMTDIGRGSFMVTIKTMLMYFVWGALTLGFGLATFAIGVKAFGNDSQSGPQQSAQLPISQPMPAQSPTAQPYTQTAGPSETSPQDTAPEPEAPEVTPPQPGPSENVAANSHSVAEPPSQQNGDGRGTDEKDGQIASKQLPLTQPTSPSFDCAKAKSVNEKLICSDSELSSLDSELSGIYQRAKATASDKTAFSQQTAIEWKWRESNCQTKACLIDWYARRKAQLLQTAN